MDDLNLEIRKAEIAVWMTKDHPNWASMLNNLALKLLARCDLTGNIDDLEAAISAAQKSVDITPEGHSYLADRLNTLAKLLSRRYLRVGKTDDLEEAIRLARKAVNVTPEGHSYLADRLETLSHLVSVRYDQMGKTDDLEEAIKLARKAVDITPEAGNDRARLLLKLAELLSDRYEPNKRALRADVSQTHLEVFKRTGNAKDLNEATRLAEEAVDITPENHPKLATRLHSLAGIFSEQYDRTGMVRYIERAVKYARKAVDIAPEDDTDLPEMLNNLSVVLVKRYYLQSKESDLIDALRLLWKAVDITPEGNPMLVASYSNLAALLVGTAPNASVEYSMKAFGCQNTRPLDRIWAARPAIQLLVDDGNFRGAAVLAEKALDLLPLVCNRYLSLDDKQNAVLRTSGLASAACSILLRNGGDPGRAVEYLEYGRGLIIGYLIDGRGDVSELADKYPEEANKFETLRSQASQSIDPREPLDVRQRLSQERDKAVADLESCLKVIRNLDGFDRFLLPPSADSLKEYAVEGPIVIVNVTSISSDTLIILRSGVKHIHLPDFSAYNARTYRRILGLTWGLSRLIKAKEKPEQDYCKFRETLKGLWTDCVQLVFDELGFRSPRRGSDLPRIWWIGTGLAASLPFHAAGVHSAGSAQNAFSRAISSYTPSIKVLQYAREKAKVKPRNQSVLLVAMPKTPGAHHLPGVEEESYAIKRVISKPHSLHILTQPSAERVLQELGDCSIAHFACHGSSDLMNPTDSFLALQGQSDSVADKLTVQQISESNLRHAWLAYLSACSTAEIQVSELADEALHLASGFQVAGFGHTIASMWPSDDDICVQVASTFYRELIMNGAMHTGNRAVPAALHTAVEKVRAENMDKPYLWAQYIHLGA